MYTPMNGPGITKVRSRRHLLPSADSGDDASLLDVEKFRAVTTDGQVLKNCSDSQAALKAISSPKTTLVQECGEALEELARYKEVELVWVPGHWNPGK
ncbi:hypothetical protein NQ317_002498 [Molorchus minor]|uniref:RNase H type-1 domain-containing protein n=1 Tax=Molorchus minor TaxID=1323400 RepID=A0ABQ9JRN3_9CUCU|nr:hypothetical protein NQ317_002498 [Molorchus minor]